MTEDIRAKAAAELAAIMAHDTDANEQRLIALAAERGIAVKRLKRKSAARYEVTTKGQICKTTVGNFTLLDIERLLAKVGT